MPDPKECRQRALEYVWLARVPASPQEREAYLNLARIWLRLAKDLGVANDSETANASSRYGTISSIRRLVRLFAANSRWPC